MRPRRAPVAATAPRASPKPLLPLPLNRAWPGLRGWKRLLVRHKKSRREVPVVATRWLGCERHSVRSHDSRQPTRGHGRELVRGLATRYNSGMIETTLPLAPELRRRCRPGPSVRPGAVGDALVGER